MKQRGDTLIEVLFGFVILGVVISVAFSGALNSYRAVMSAQDRTQATFAVKYQAEALKTYRASLLFSDFVNGIGLSSLDNSTLCMKENEDQTYWVVNMGKEGCPELAKKLAPNLNNPSLTITATKNNSSMVTAIVKLDWNSRGSGQKDNITNTVVLTKGVEQ